VKFLIDHNLSPKLVHHLKDSYPGSVHTADIGFDRTPDQELWKYAAQHGFHILTKDTDYEQISMLKGAPPKVVWLRIGNAPTRTVLMVLDSYRTEIEQFLYDDERTLLALSL